MSDPLPHLPPRRLRALHKDPVKSAAAIDLRYVNDGKPGIERIRHGGNFRYRYKGEPVKDKEILGRIRSLAIPPAWTDVWICPFENGHLQATGKDARGRKQYRYHPRWSTVRGKTKFNSTLAFGEQLPAIRERLKKDLALPGLCREKVLATVVSIMDRTQIRVGSSEYEKQNKSYGLSTLKDRHVKQDGAMVRLAFKGKTGIAHDVKIESRRLSKLVMRCRELPGQELFQYLDDNGEARPIDSGMVNDYIREISEGPFTSKDFRTWKGTVHCLKALLLEACPQQSKARKEAINKALDEAAKQLGNTRAVCRKYYVHPEVLTAYDCARLHRLMQRNGAALEQEPLDDGYTIEERLVLKVLRTAGRAAARARQKEK